MKNIHTLIALSFLVTLPASAEVVDKGDTGASGSLWQNGRNPLLDRTAREVGDLVTILISEQTVASYGASTSATKADNNSLGTNVLNTVFGLLKPSPTSTAASTNTGQGSTTQNGSLRARLTAEVKAVTPRGHLIVEGTRSVVINKQTQIFKLSGIVRRDDISPDNSVLSESLAQAEIRLEGKGSIADRQRKGLLTQVVDWLF